MGGMVIQRPGSRILQGCIVHDQPGDYADQSVYLDYLSRNHTINLIEIVASAEKIITAGHVDRRGWTVAVAIGLAVLGKWLLFTPWIPWTTGLKSSVRA